MLKQFIPILIAFVVTSTASAEVQEFETEQRTDFFAGIGGKSNVTTIDFTGFPNNTNITDQYDSLGVTFEGLNFITLDVPSFEDDWCLRIFEGNHLYFEQPISWIAADFLGTMMIDLYVGDQLFHTSDLLGSAGLDEFGGLISDQQFDHVFIYDAGDFLTVLDDLHFGPPIPAPGVIAPLAMLCLVRRRRRIGSRCARKSR